MNRPLGLVRLCIVVSSLLILMLMPAVASASLIVTPFFSPWTSGGTASLPATITGYVKDGGGVGIAGIHVQVHGDTGSTNPVAQSFVQTATTDSNGRYVLTDIIEGTYGMSVNEAGYGAHPEYGEARPWHEDEGTGDTREYIEGGTPVSVTDIVLKDNGAVSGHAMNGATPVPGAAIEADIVDGDITYRRWATTGADGSYSIPDAPAGDWTITFMGSGAHVPQNAEGSSRWATDGDPATQSPPLTFTLAENETKTNADCAFETGQNFTPATVEEFATTGTTYQVSGIAMALTAVGSARTFYLTTGDDGRIHSAYLPVGIYSLSLNDPNGAYEDRAYGDITLSPTGAWFEPIHLTPRAGTFAVYGTPADSADTGKHFKSWIRASRKDGTDLEFVKRVISNGAGSGENGRYMIRLPAVTGYTGNKYQIDIDEWTDPTVRGATPEHVRYSFEAMGPTPFLYDPPMSKGGAITGVVLDEVGNPVPGVQVSAWHRTTDEWTGDEYAWTLTRDDGSYAITGLPANSDYKVTFQPYYDPGEALPEKYGAYYRRIWQHRPLADSLATSATPVIVDHDPVAVSLATTRTGIDETITPGGYVALHADGPEYPTGAVYCDVMYNVGGNWIEIDSGFTTGGTFQKLWKVLPTGDYRVDYSDYFGRGGGSWTFALGEGEHKYASVLVPAPIEYMSAMSSSVSGAFLGYVGENGLPEGGPSDIVLQIDKLSAMPATAPALASTLTSAGGIYDFSAEGTSAAGVWTLKLPYSSSVPNNLVGMLRVRHFKQDGSSEVLVPFTWNTVNHTLMVQTTSLSPFQVLLYRRTVSLGTPSAPSHAHAYRAFTVYGSLKPQHTAGARSVQLKIYRYSSGKYRYYKTVWTKNYNYSSYTRYKTTSLKLRSGRYRIYGYAPADSWHLATKTSRYDSLRVY